MILLRSYLKTICDRVSQSSKTLAMQARFAVVVKDDGFVIKRAMRAARGGLQVASSCARLPQLHDVVKSLINRLLGNKTPRRVGWPAGWFSIVPKEGGGGWLNLLICLHQRNPLKMTPFGVDKHLKILVHIINHNTETMKNPWLNQLPQ